MAQRSFYDSYFFELNLSEQQSTEDQGRIPTDSELSRVGTESVAEVTPASQALPSGIRYTGYLTSEGHDIETIRRLEAVKSTMLARRGAINEPTRLSDLFSSTSRFEDDTCFAETRNLFFDWRKTRVIWGMPSGWILAVSFVLPVLYGGVHLTAWSFEFPSWLEHLLWKIACITIMVTVPIVAMLRLIFETIWYETSIEDCVDWAYYIIQGVAVLIYTCSRCFIVVESFASLRMVPIGVYWTPAWLQMIPHA
jgi:hypothetical protein